MNEKIAIIGGGISGLSCARLLGSRMQTVVFERMDRPGGLLKCERHDGSLFHTCGGHVFNTKYKRVADWFWSIFNRDRDFVKAVRHAAVCMPNNLFVNYPIENNVYQLDEGTQRAFRADLERMMAMPREQAENFDQFLKIQFGPTLYKLYFKPYNDKIWGRDLREIPLSWLDGKLPMPTPQEMLEANAKHVEENKFVHSSFYYPKFDGSQFLIDRLSKGVEVRTGVDVRRMRKTADGKWRFGDEEFDAVIYCGSVKDVCKIFEGLELGGFDSKIAGLESHGTTALFCQIDPNPYSWVYQPNPAHASHRIICTGNFAASNNAPGVMTATIEFTGEIAIEQAKAMLSLMPFSPRYITHHYTPVTYPIQHHDTRDVIESVKEYLERDNVYLCGRFAEWEYFNMDVAIHSAMQLSDRLMQRIEVRK